MKQRRKVGGGMRRIGFFVFTERNSGGWGGGIACVACSCRLSGRCAGGG